MWVAIVNRNRRGDIVRSCPVRGETKPAALEKRLIADRASVSALDDENQWKRGSFEPPWRRLVRRITEILADRATLGFPLRCPVLHAWHIKLVKDSGVGIKSQKILVLEPNGRKRVVAQLEMQHHAGEASHFPNRRNIPRSFAMVRGFFLVSRSAR